MQSYRSENGCFIARLFATMLASYSSLYPFRTVSASAIYVPPHKELSRGLLIEPSLVSLYAL